MKFFLLIFILLCSFVSFAQEHKTLEISHLSGDFYVYTTYRPYDGSPYPSNGMYVVTTEGAIIIDSPWDTTQFQSLLDIIKARHHKDAVMCIATHSHSDRTAALEYYNDKGIRTYTTVQTDEISKQKNERRAAFLMTKDTVFTIGNHSFQTFYPGKGHAPDNIVVWFEKERILYGGCFIKSVESPHLGNLEDADVIEWGGSIKRVQQRFKAPNYIIPGHQSWEDKGSLKHTADMVRVYNRKKKS